MSKKKKIDINTEMATIMNRIREMKDNGEEIDSKTEEALEVINIANRVIGSITSGKQQTLPVLVSSLIASATISAPATFVTKFNDGMAGCITCLSNESSSSRVISVKTFRPRNFSLSRISSNLNHHFPLR